MSDRELLELAAKACGLPECGWMGPAFMYVKDNTFTGWNPLQDDADEARLEAKLGLDVCWHPTGVLVGPGPFIGNERTWCTEYFDAHDGIDARQAARRRAGVRAAAAIGATGSAS